MNINDVARASGVSRGTVSRAFNERSDINAKTRERVLKIARQMGYVPNANARGLAKGRTDCVGVVVPDVVNVFLAEQVSAIERQLRAHGKTAILGLTHGQAADERNILGRMVSGQVDGIIMTPCEDEQGVHYINEINRRLPVVSLKDFPGLECATLMGDDRRGIHLVMEHLIELRHQRIAFACHSGQQWSAHERLAAYREAIAAKGLAAEVVITVPPVDEPDFEEELRAQVKRLLTEGGAESPTAIVAFDDMIAIYLVRALIGLGIRVPEDVSVTGFDNIRFAAMTEVPVTSVAAGSDDLGTHAVRLLLAAAARETAEPVHTRLPMRLHVRRSTAPPPEHAFWELLTRPESARQARHAARP